MLRPSRYLSLLLLFHLCFKLLLYQLSELLTISFKPPKPSNQTITFLHKLCVFLLLFVLLDSCVCTLCVVSMINVFKAVFALSSSVCHVVWIVGYHVFSEEKLLL